MKTQSVVSPVGFNVRNRDVQSVISEVTKGNRCKSNFQWGYYVKYGGQFENLQAAKARLAVAVPVALLLIFVLLFFTFHSVKQALLIYTAITHVAHWRYFGTLAAWYEFFHFSRSWFYRFLFGITVLNGIVLIAEFNRLEKEILDITERVIKG